MSAAWTSNSQALLHASTTYVARSHGMGTSQWGRTSYNSNNPLDGSVEGSGDGLSAYEMLRQAMSSSSNITGEKTVEIAQVVDTLTNASNKVEADETWCHEIEGFGQLDGYFGSTSGVRGRTRPVLTATSMRGPDVNSRATAGGCHCIINQPSTSSHSNSLTASHRSPSRLDLALDALTVSVMEGIEQLGRCSAQTPHMPPRKSLDMLLDEAASPSCSRALWLPNCKTMAPSMDDVTADCSACYF